MLVFIILLSILVIGLIIFLLLLKREIWSVKKQLQEYSNGVEKPIDVVFIDKNLTGLAAEINKNQTMKREQEISILKRERKLKESISNISHDLRTPLTSMIGYLQLLQKTELVGEQREYIDIVLTKSRYLQVLMNDFYDISVLEGKSNSLILEKINLNNILLDAVLSFTEQLEEKEITPIIISCDMPVYVMADETMLKRVIINLISNAIRYGTKEFQITISEKEDVEVVFQNEIGKGISIEVSKLFEKFYTADDCRNQRGSGLGLYIVRILTETMKGSVFATLDDDKLAIKVHFMKGVD